MSLQKTITANSNIFSAFISWITKNIRTAHFLEALAHLVSCWESSMPSQTSWLTPPKHQHICWTAYVIVSIHKWVKTSLPKRAILCLTAPDKSSHCWSWHTRISSTDQAHCNQRALWSCPYAVSGRDENKDFFFLDFPFRPQYHQGLSTHTWRVLT